MISTTADTMAPSSTMMVVPVFRKDKSATEEFSRQYTNICEPDRGEGMSLETAVIESQAQLFALLSSPPLAGMHQPEHALYQSAPFSPTTSDKSLADIKLEASDELADLFNLTIDDILDHSNNSSIYAEVSDFEEEQQRFQEFVFLQNYPFAEDAVNTVLVHGKRYTESSASYPSPSETVASPVTPGLDWAYSPSPSPSLASPIMESNIKFEPYPAADSSMSLRRASISSACSSSSCSSVVGPVKSRPRGHSKAKSPSTQTSTMTNSTTTTTTIPTSVTTTATATTNRYSSGTASQAHITPRRRHRAVPATALVVEPGMKMVRNKDGSIAVFNPATEEVTYRCSLCPAERFGRIHDYKRHQMSKHQERVWPCEFCHRPFVRRDALLRHYAVKADRDDNVHPTKEQANLLDEARARAKLIG